MQTNNCHSFLISDQTPILVIFRRVIGRGQSTAITLKGPDHFIAELHAAQSARAWAEPHG